MADYRVPSCWVQLSGTFVSALLFYVDYFFPLINGHAVGGVLGDIHIRRPFEVAFFLYIVSTVYGALFLPTSTLGNVEAQKHPTSGVAAFFAPLKIIRAHRYRLASGQIIKNYGLVFLAWGIFLGVVSHPSAIC